MSKRFMTLNGSDFTQMVLAGAESLRSNVNNVNALNVFPVPDGDTGTNMNMTMTSGVEELKKRSGSHIGKAAEALSKGLLMGARGNSGVILSQLFRGFAKAVHDYEEVNAQQFAAALQQGVDTAYKAVVKPVEGTVLTVSREAAKHGVAVSRRAGDIAEVMREVLLHGKQALAKTPDQLPVLKQVGVVDAGGQGLIHIYEGFHAVLSGAEFIEHSPIEEIDLAEEAHEMLHHAPSAQSMLATEDIEHGYCTEFLINLVEGKVRGYLFQETDFREELSKFGDSLLVVADDNLVKVHIHAEYPGQVLNHVMNYGDLSRIKIENMRDQHTHILETGEYGSAHPAVQGSGHAAEPAAETPEPVKPFGIVAVAMGDGITEILKSLGADEVISGGQTMNPSTEDIVNAVRRVRAETVFVLPNNSNIILAAQQAKDLVDTHNIIVLPTKTIPQGMAALLAFHSNASAEANEKTMGQALAQVRSGQVTYSIRDTSIDGVDIKEGDYLGILDNKIVVSERELTETCARLIDEMLEQDGDILTILEGEDARKEDTRQLAKYVKQNHPQVEIEIHAGGQPVYTYLFSVE